METEQLVEKLYDFRALHLRRTPRGRWVPCPPSQALLTVKLHGYLQTSLDFHVLRIIFDKETKETNALKVATFSRRRWAKDYVRYGMLSCSHPCVHGKECKQIRPAFNNSAPNLLYCFLIVGRGKLITNGKVFRYLAKDKKKKTHDLSSS